MNQSFFSSLKLNLKYVLPKRCRFACCKETTKDRLFFEGYKKLKKEIEIQTILKSLRLVKAATKLNFTEDQWNKFKDKNAHRELHLTSITQKNKFKTLTDKDKKPGETKKAEAASNPVFGGILSKFGGGPKPKPKNDSAPVQ